MKCEKFLLYLSDHYILKDSFVSTADTSCIRNGKRGRERVPDQFQTTKTVSRKTVGNYAKLQSQ